jgi:hypothetical protein
VTASASEERAAFDQLTAELRNTAAANARALRDRRGTPAGDVLERQLEHTLDRLAAMYGRGTYENLTTEDIVRAAVGNELRLAAGLDGPESALAATRARSLVDAARRGVRLHPREAPSSVRPHRGAYVEPLRPELQASLRSRHEPFIRWGDGVVLVLSDKDADALRAAGYEVDVLFLDADELLDLDGRDDRPALEAELGRRQRAARSAPDRVGDSRDAYLLRLLMGQTIVLRNLRDRLTDGHPSAHEAMLPILAGHTALLTGRLAAQAPASPTPAGEAPAGEGPAGEGPAGEGQTPAADPLAASIEGERNVQSLAGRWAVEPGDVAGLRGRFRAVAEAGTRLADLERIS